MKCSQVNFIFCLIFTIWGTIICVEGKKYMRCELSEELLNKHKVDKTFLSNWVCLVEHESNSMTNAVNLDKNGSKKYGLFQINGKDWCRENRKGGKCNMKCEDLLNNDISDDVACAMKVMKTQGFRSWDNWSRYCYSSNLPNLKISCSI